MAGATDRSPEWDVSITSGATVIEGNFVNNQGERDPRSFRMQQQPRMSLKMYQGGTKHSDTEPPYRSIEKRDYSGGRGINVYEDDATRFMRSYRANTWMEGQVMLGPEEQYGDGVRDDVENWWDNNADTAGDLTRIPLYGATVIVSYKFTTPAGSTYSPKYLHVPTGREGITGGSFLTAYLYDDDSGEPGSPVHADAYWLGQSTDVHDEVLRLEIYAVQALTAATDYHVVFWGGSGGGESATDHVYVYGGDDVPASTCFKSTDALSWTAYGKSLFFRLTEDDDDYEAFFVEHLGSLYSFHSFKDSEANNPKVWKNGDNGTATSATATTIVDSTKSWTTDAWINAIVVLHSGTGAHAKTRWRLITDNDGTSLTVADWDEQPEMNTRYAIVHTNIWTEVTGHGLVGRITDVEVIHNIVYICRGDFNVLVHMYDDTFATETGNAGTFITGATDTGTGQLAVYLATRGFPPLLYKADPVWTDDGLTITDLDFEGAQSSEITVLDWDAESGVSNWVSVGTTQITQDSDTKYQGNFSVLCAAVADDEGMEQAITVEPGVIHHLSARIRGTALLGVELKFGDVVVDTVSGLGAGAQWHLVEGKAESDSTSEAITFLSTSNLNAFNVDVVRLRSINANLTEIGDERITNILPFGNDNRLHVITTGGIYAEWNGNYYKISPEELSEIKDDRNGVAALEHGPYLYMSFLDGIGRYSAGQDAGRFDQVGPNMDEGMGEDYRGNIVSLVGYPERMYAALDGGASSYSTVLLYNGLGWHEVYRTPAKGMPIKGLHIQTLPDTYVDRLWFNEGADLVWVGVDLNPRENNKYRYCPFGHVEISNIYLEQREVDKYWSDMKVTGRDNDNDDLNTSNYLEAYYRNTSTDLWAFIGTYDASESHDINYTGKYLETPYIALRSDNSLESPRLDAVTIDLIEHLPSKWSYSWRMKLGDLLHTRSGTPDYAALSTTITNLKALVNTATPVTVRTSHPYADNLTVKLMSMDLQPFELDQRGQLSAAIVEVSAIDT